MIFGLLQLPTTPGVVDCEMHSDAVAFSCPMHSIAITYCGGVVM